MFFCLNGVSSSLEGNTNGGRCAVVSEILVMGHRNPDTDAICSAIGYAEFKRLMGFDKVIAARCGDINDRISFVLRRFGVGTASRSSSTSLSVSFWRMERFLSRNFCILFLVCSLFSSGVLTGLPRYLRLVPEDPGHGDL